MSTKKLFEGVSALIFVFVHYQEKIGEFVHSCCDQIPGVNCISWPTNRSMTSVSPLVKSTSHYLCS